MFRFSIRELMLLTALVAISMAWFVESRGAEVAEWRSQRVRGHAERLRESLDLAEWECRRMADWIEYGQMEAICGNTPRPQWDLAKQAIP